MGFDKGAIRIVDVLRLRFSIFIVISMFRQLLQQWIPRELNACADDILNIIVFDDWYTSQGFFAHLDLIWGPYTVDRFADAFNADPAFQI